MPENKPLMQTTSGNLLLEVIFHRNEAGNARIGFAWSDQNFSEQDDTEGVEWVSSNVPRIAEMLVSGKAKTQINASKEALKKVGTPEDIAELVAGVCVGQSCDRLLYAMISGLKSDRATAMNGIGYDADLGTSFWIVPFEELSKVVSAKTLPMFMFPACDPGLPADPQPRPDRLIIAVLPEDWTARQRFLEAMNKNRTDRGYEPMEVNLTPEVAEFKKA